MNIVFCIIAQNPTSSNSFVWMLSSLALYILYFESFIIYLRPYSDFTLSFCSTNQKSSRMKLMTMQLNCQEIDKHVKPQVISMLNNKTIDISTISNPISSTLIMVRNRIETN